MAGDVCRVGAIEVVVSGGDVLGERGGAGVGLLVHVADQVFQAVPGRVGQRFLVHPPWCCHEDSFWFRPG
ncbi:hypothetical protein [Kitasatospora sp. NPDC050543]|uniref:hypothetical protein n=1 Tax=Kitasatospora sp. NPDC050543 TaxID=3364054 RepID=UPI0037975FEB